jgi:hypothetical protein
VYFVVTLNLIICYVALTQDATGVIQLATGEKVYGKVELKEPFLRKSYLLLNDSVEYKIKDIDRFQSDDGYFAKLPKSSKLVKRTVQGKIALYEETVTNFFLWILRS